MGADGHSWRTASISSESYSDGEVGTFWALDLEITVTEVKQ